MGSEMCIRDRDKTSSKKSEEFSFGTAAEFKPDMAVKKILEVDDLSKLAHANVSINRLYEKKEGNKKHTRLRYQIINPSCHET